MLSLLSDTLRPGYPDDYLVSRLHGRLQQKVVGAQGEYTERNMFHENDKHIWDVAAGEREWLYQQMEWKLRKTLAPLLIFFEISGLILGLREMEAGTGAETAAVDDL